MAELNSIERIKLDKLFIDNGYVLDFSNQRFADFFRENVGIEIYDLKYSDSGESKGNRLRIFFKKETNNIVAKLLFALLAYYKEVFILSQYGWTDEIEDLYKFAVSIANRLQGEIGEHVDAIKISTEDKGFETVGKSVKQLINENKPEEAIDRLHTYFTMLIRKLCEKHSISIDNKATHSLLGEYIKLLSNKGLLESIMSERILKNSISIIDAFNEVRNNRSLAHANTLLGYDESLFIFKAVSSTIEFINSIELRIDSKNPKAIADLPF